jgi:hypothetical protein
MPTLQITDDFGLSTSLQLGDDSPFAKAGLTHLSSIGRSIKDEIDKPIDQTSLKGFTFGATWSSPSSTIGADAKVSGGSGVSGAFSIARPADKTLFSSGGFAPDVKIAVDQCWVGLEIDASVNAGVKLSADGFGAGISGSTKLGLTTYKLIGKSGGQFPDLVDAVKTALDGFYIASTAEALRSQPVGTACVNELSGSVSFTGSYQLPVSISALASADLPLNYQISVQPEATLKLSGCIALSGDLIVRAHKVTDTTLEIGVYKKKGSTLTATFSADAGVEVEHGTTDLIAAILGVAFPKVDSKAAGVTGDDASEMNDALQDCLDHSLAISMNASCSAATTDEAAVIYSIDLSSGNADATNAALKSALRGDWTLLSNLPAAKQLRNIVKDAKEYKHKIAINLFGIYNASSETDYVKSCTILHAGGQVSVIDKASASRISVAATPYAADPDKVRNALAEDFLTTVTYTIVASKLQPALAVQQSYFVYDKAMTRQEMLDQILLGAALKLFQKSDWASTLADNAVFPHTHVSASAKYDDAGTLKLFFADPVQQKPRTQAELETIGRDALIAVIDPGDPAGAQRLQVLNDPQIWSAMDKNGNVANFNSIPGLSQLPAPVLGAVGADWAAIVWWATSMTQVAPKLADLLAFLATIPAGDFSTNPDFMAKRKALQGVLGGVAKNTHAAFAGGWGMAVIFALAGTAERTMDITWNSQTKHYEENS